jgi:hypothetical protein
MIKNLNDNRYKLIQIYEINFKKNRSISDKSNIKCVLFSKVL